MIVGRSRRRYGPAFFQVKCLDPYRSMTIGHSLLTTIASNDAAIESHASSIQRACPVMRASPAPMVAIKSAKAASAQTMKRKALSISNRLLLSARWVAPWEATTKVEATPSPTIHAATLQWMRRNWFRRMAQRRGRCFGTFNRDHRRGTCPHHGTRALD